MTPDKTMTIERVDPSDPAAVRLLRMSDRLMASLYPAESNHMESVEELKQPNVAFFGCYVGGELVACGAVKMVAAGGERYGEIKRLFVDQAHRGGGLSRVLMTHLERHLAAAGIHTARLEVGVDQPAALALYARLGYRERPPFGPYAADPLSVFMEKRLPDGGDRPAPADAG